MYSYCIVFILDVRTKGQPDKRMDGHTDGRTSVCRDSFPRLENQTTHKMKGV